MDPPREENVLEFKKKIHTLFLDFVLYFSIVLHGYVALTYAHSVVTYSIYTIVLETGSGRGMFSPVLVGALILVDLFLRTDTAVKQSQAFARAQ